MSTHSSAPGRGPYRKPRADLYTMLLALALAAIIIGTVCAYFETKDYGSPPHKGAPQVRLEIEGPAVASAATFTDGIHSIADMPRFPLLA